MMELLSFFYRKGASGLGYVGYLSLQELKPKTRATGDVASSKQSHPLGQIASNLN